MTGHRIPLDLYMADWEALDPGTGNTLVSDLDRKCYRLVIAANAETNTLAAPDKAGMILVLTAYSVATGGTDERIVTSATDISMSGQTTITLATAGDTIMLISVTIGSSILWRIVFNDGCELS